MLLLNVYVFTLGFLYKTGLDGDSFKDWEVISQNRVSIIYRRSRSEVFLGKGILKICSKFTGEHPCQSMQLYWNHTWAWVCSCKFAASFQNTFSLEHLWRVASVSSRKKNFFDKLSQIITFFLFLLFIQEQGFWKLFEIKWRKLLFGNFGKKNSPLLASKALMSLALHKKWSFPLGIF